MSQTTFPCPFCGRKMGVGPDMLGRKVRCPNPQCKQVLVAPLATSPAEAAPPAGVVVPPSPPAAPAPVVPAPAPGLPPELPVFNLPAQEAQDSIFGEATEESDDVFGSDSARKPVPEMPPAEPPPAPPVAAYAAPAAVPAPLAADPFAGFTATPVVVPVPPAPPIAAVPYPPPAAPANPWAGFDQPAPPAVVPQAVYAAPPAAYPGPPAAVPAEPEPLPAAMIDDEPPAESRPRRRPEADRDDRPRRDRRPPEKAAGGVGGLIKIGFFLLLPYAFLMTVLAAYGLFLRDTGKAPDGHPLSLIPDSRGEFPPAERKKSGKLGVPLDGPLPPELKAGLGQKVAVGAVTVEPVSVTVRKLAVEKVTEGGKTYHLNPGKGVTLTLRVTNTSPDLTIYPLDPAFNRKEFVSDSPPSAIVVGKSTFAGGPVAWPFEKGVRRAYEKAQEGDDRPLGPGESRTYVVTSDTRPEIARAVLNAKDTILWRVQVRRGLVEYRGREVPVTALVGVEFTKADVTEE